jgi:hypothetical protein
MFMKTVEEVRRLVDVELFGRKTARLLNIKEA